jgi:hypothetical protein
MTNKRITYTIFWLLYFVAMGQLYFYMQEKIPEYIDKEVIRRGH